jgi:hypothetical protein
MAILLHLPKRYEVDSRRLGEKFLPSSPTVHWKCGQPAALEVTAISMLQQLTVRGVSTTRGHALVIGEERKMTAHAEACH